MILDKLVSAIHNDVAAGLRGYHTNMSMSREQTADDIIDMRLQIIKEYSLKGILPYKDLLTEINCIPVDCKNIENCRCKKEFGTPTMHFEIPQLLNDYGAQAIQYIGSTDKQLSFLWYTSLPSFTYSKYKRRKITKPMVFIDTTPNENGMYDCWVFNAPLLKEVSVIAIFKDPRQLERYSCCSSETLEDDNFNFINNEIKQRLTKLKLYYYRQVTPPNLPNNQEYAAG